MTKAESELLCAIAEALQTAVRAATGQFVGNVPTVDMLREALRKVAAERESDAWSTGPR